MVKILKNYIYKKIFRNINEYDITYDELKSKQLNGAQIIDVRSTQEYEEGHIQGAINIPEYKINENVEKILKNKNEEIVVYCSSGSRSIKAYKKLSKFGYKNIFNLYGGTDNWEII